MVEVVDRLVVEDIVRFEGLTVVDKPLERMEAEEVVRDTLVDVDCGRLDELVDLNVVVVERSSSEVGIAGSQGSSIVGEKGGDGSG